MNVTDSGFELREHTADVVLHVWGATLDALFCSAADGFYAVLGEVVTTDVAEPIRVELQAPDATDLFHDWLAELLFLFETRRARVTDIAFDVLTEKKLLAVGRARKVDLVRSRFDGEVKAVTYHGLAVTNVQGRYEASVILDL